MQEEKEVKGHRALEGRASSDNGVGLAPSSGLMGCGVAPPIPGAESGGPTYLVLDVGMDSLQHPLTGVLVGQVGVYLWERWADTWGRRRPGAP